MLIFPSLNVNSDVAPLGKCLNKKKTRHKTINSTPLVSEVIWRITLSTINRKRKNLPMTHRKNLPLPNFMRATTSALDVVVTGALDVVVTGALDVVVTGVLDVVVTTDSR